MRVGVWTIGALGDVATTAAVGARAIARGLAPPTGLVSAREPFAGLDLVGLDGLVFGGWDVRSGSPLEAAQHLARGGVVPSGLVGELGPDLEAYAERLRPGVTFGAGRLVRDLESPAARERRASGPRGAVEAARADLRAFREAEGLDRVVVVALASTEPKAELPASLTDEGGVLGAVADGAAELPASLLYALAAFEEGCPFVNFTPSVGATPTGMQELALSRGVPHAGSDGKTGETLLRTTLAPMFRDRGFDVLSWSGFNVLGNRDGEVLDEPDANAAKTTGKDKVLGTILGEQLGSSLTRIDYVPSLADWKTAWDLVHFEGFLGTRMQLEFTWRGADSALAAPLVLDLVRFVDLAARRGRRGVQTGLSCFFKTPLGVSEHAFAEQMRMLEQYASELRGAPAPRRTATG